MKGFGSYHDWDYYASPHSNLSAFAAPFSVNRPTLSDVSAPFFDSADAAPPNPVHSQTYVYDDFLSDSVSKSHMAPPYFPSYISPTNHSPTSSVAPNYWSSSSGFDGRSLGDYADKSHELGFTDQGAVTWNLFAEFNHGKGKQVGAGSSFCSMQTGSVVEERMNQGCQVMKESNNGEVLHMTDWKKHKRAYSCDQLDDKCSWWEPIKPMPVEFSGHLRMHLDRNEPSSSNNAMISDEDFSKDVADYVKARHGFQNPPNLDNLSLCLDSVMDLNSVEKSFEHGDQRNPAVDSPCWKGVFAAHSSHYKSSEALPPEYEHKDAECFGSVIQETKSFLLDTVNNVKKSCENSNSSQCTLKLLIRKQLQQSEPSCDYGLQYLDGITEMKENSMPPTKPIDGEIGSSHTEHQVIGENKLMSQSQNTLCIGGADTGYNVNKCLESGAALSRQINASFKWPQLTKIRPESSKVDDKNLLVQEANLRFRSGKPNWKLSDSISARGDAESTKADNMTKALKRILSENFHDDDEEESQTVLYKNLWLEAEAALCSMYYRDRYRQMKIEMEKHSYKQRANILLLYVDMEEQSKPEAEVIVPSQSSATEVHNYPNPDFSAQDLPVSHATNPEDLSLYQVLKNGVDKPCLNTTNLEEPSDKLAPRGRENQNQVNFCQDSPNPEHEASVVARFHILKSRVEDSKGKSLGVDLNSYTAAVEKSILKEFHLDLEDNQQIHDSQLPTYYSDGLASDWEHVE
ncbi:hypothetical protein SESBI_29456 [Sesbania bispinosa]|nr:hypothetical protein SESBI_29456 [Sesbania bispinosa]